MVRIILKNMFATVGFVFVTFSFCFSPVYGSSNKISIEKTYDDEKSITNKMNIPAVLNDSNDRTDFKMDDLNERNANVTNPSLFGLTFINNTWQLGLDQVAYFNSSYHPISSPLPDGVEFESNSTLSCVIFERSINGINNFSLFVTTPTVPDPHQRSSSPEMVYSFARLLDSKCEVNIDAAKLIPSQSFVEYISDIVRSNSSSLERTKKLVQTLNKYGWYMPVHYILGGAFYEIERAPTDNQTNLMELSNALKDHLEATYMTYAESADRLTNSSSYPNHDERKNVEKLSVGANGASNIETFIENVKDEKNWQIIKYIEFHPTLLLLKQAKHWEFSEGTKLLRDHYYLNDIKQLQNQINMEKYGGDLSDALSPGGF